MKAAVAALNTLVCNSDGVRGLSRHPRPRTPEHPNTRKSLDGGFEKKHALFCSRARASGCAPTAAMVASTAAVATIAAPSARISFENLVQSAVVDRGASFLTNPPHVVRVFPMVLCVV